MNNKTAEEIIKKHIPNGCINLNSYQKEIKAISAAMEEYASQLSTPSIRWVKAAPPFPKGEVYIKAIHDGDIIKDVGEFEFMEGYNQWRIKWNDQGDGCLICEYDELYYLDESGELSPSLEEWISVEDQPLFIKTERGWECTEAGDRVFIAAVPYKDKRKEGDHWWIRLCVVEDGIGLCVVGDDDNEPAGWMLEDVTHYIPQPSAPKKFLNK